MSQWEEDQSLRNFVDSLSDTDVDLEPVTYTPPSQLRRPDQQEEEYETPEEAAKRKKKKIIIIVSVIVLLLTSGIGTALWLSHNNDLVSDYEKARTDYEELREEALDKISNAEVLAEQCRTAIDNRATCTRLDDAISDTEEKSKEIEEKTPSQEAIDELKKATKDLRTSLEDLDAASKQVEEEMGDSIGVYLHDLLSEAKQASSSGHAALNEARGAMENETDGDELESLLKRLDRQTENASKMLSDESSTTLADGVSATEANNAAQSLSKLIDSVTEETAAVRRSHQTYLNNKAQQEQEAQRQQQNNSGGSPTVAPGNPTFELPTDGPGIGDPDIPAVPTMPPNPNWPNLN